MNKIKMISAQRVNFTLGMSLYFFLFKHVLGFSPEGQILTFTRLLLIHHGNEMEKL